MATVELALGVGALAIAVSAVIGVLAVLAAQLGCQSVAGEIARQLARGDQSAVSSALARLPEGAVIQQSRSRSAVQVRVGLAVHPFGDRLPAVRVLGSSTVIWEPGEGTDG